MAGLIVGKIVFANAVSYYGLELCLKKAGLTTYSVSEKTAKACDVLLVSLFWYRDILFLENFLRKSGLKNRKGKPVIIAGGLQATITPKVVAEMVDYVFVGDGDDYLGGIVAQVAKGEKPDCKYLYHRKMEKVPAPAECKPDFFMYEHHALKRIPAARKRKERIRQNYQRCPKIYRMEIARGCKYKCPFCVLSALKTYREVSAKEIIENLRKLSSGTTVGCFAPDRTAHGHWSEIQDVIFERRLRDYGSDVRLENLDKINRDSAILGLEGISYRLRKSVNKPYKEDFILAKIKEFATTGRRVQYGANLGIYFIADLPGENDDDWKEIYELFAKISEADWSRQLTISPVLNPLSPKPFTKLFNAEIHPFRNYPARWEKLLRGGTGNSRWGFRVKEYSVWGAWERVVDAIIHKGEERGYKIISRLKPHLLLHNVGGWDRSVGVSKVLLNQCQQLGLTEELLFGVSEQRSN